MKIKSSSTKRFLVKSQFILMFLNNCLLNDTIKASKNLLNTLKSMSFEGRMLEKRETEPKHNVIIVDFLRHGTTEYQENFATHEEKMAMNGNYPRDLTPKGEQEVRETVEKIVHTIDPQKDVVVLWSCPKSKECDYQVSDNKVEKRKLKSKQENLF